MGGGGGEALPLRGHGDDADSEVDGDPSGPGEHADAAMLELGLAEVVHGHVVGDAEGVEANVTDVSLEIRGGGKEGKGLRLLGGEEGGGSAAWVDVLETRLGQRRGRGRGRGRGRRVDVRVSA